MPPSSNLPKSAVSRPRSRVPNGISRDCAELEAQLDEGKGSLLSHFSDLTSQAVKWWLLKSGRFSAESGIFFQKPLLNLVGFPELVSLLNSVQAMFQTSGKTALI